MERLFLEQASKNNFAGVALHPTPFKPTNIDLIKKLRLDGMKIVELSPVTCDYVSDCGIFVDLEHCGYLATSQLAMRGYRNIAYVNHKNKSIYEYLIHKGIVQAINDLNLNLTAEITFDKWLPKEDSAQLIQKQVKNHGHLFDTFKSLPDNTGIISLQSDLSMVISSILNKINAAVPEKIGLCNALSDDRLTGSISMVKLPFEKQLEKAVTFITDTKTNATDKFFEYLKSSFECRETVRQLPGDL